MSPDELRSLRVGQRVVVRDAGNQLRSGTVDPVPREWRRRGDGDAFTTLGRFPKVWVRFAVRRDAVPWPAEDVFTDIKAAATAQAVAAHEQQAAQ